MREALVALMMFVTGAGDMDEASTPDAGEVIEFIAKEVEQQRLLERDPFYGELPRDAAEASVERPPAPTPKSDSVEPVDPLAGIDQVWLDLADCESGNWTGNSHEVGSARWDWGADLSALPPWASIIGGERGAQFHGGLQFHPDTWDWVAPMVLDNPTRWAWQATPQEQVAVAERTQELQGWGAWPVCSLRIDLP